MSYARAFSSKDTWITEYSTTANFGLTPVLEVWNKINDRRDKRKEFARILIKFGPIFDQNLMIFEVQKSSKFDVNFRVPGIAA